MKSLEELKQIDLAEFAELDDNYIRLQGDLAPTQMGAVKIVSNTWSAILDTKTCELCRSLDGKTLPEGHPDFEAYQPPLHGRCRCLFLGSTTESPYKPPINWEPPDSGLVEKFGNFLRELPEKELPEIIAVWEPTKIAESPKWAYDEGMSKLNKELMSQAKNGEAFILIDGSNGRRVLIRGGGKDFVQLPDLDKIMKADKATKFISVHNHPRSASFGPEDLDTFIRSTQWGARHHMVFGNDGTKYKIIFPKGQNWMDKHDAITFSWKYEGDKLMDVFRPKVLSGEMDEFVAWKEHTNLIMEKLSKKYKFIYERVLP